MPKIHYKSLPEKTADVISDLIYQKNYMPGTKLPNEIELAQELEVSRNTVREAIRLLTERGVLEVRRGSGTFVSAKISLTEDPLGLSLICDKKKLAWDLMEIRLMIEPRMASMAAEHATAAEIGKLKDTCRRLEEAVQKGNHYYEADMEFHTMVAGCSRNLVVHNIIPAINQTILLQENIFSEPMKQKTVDYHWRICRAIEKHQCNEAYQAMLAHLVTSRERLFDIK